MRIPAILALLISLSSCDYFSSTSADSKALAAVKANSARTAQFHVLNDKVQSAQASLQDFVTTEQKKCEIQHLKLLMTPAGDLACQEPPKDTNPTQVIPPPPTKKP